MFHLKARRQGEYPPLPANGRGHLFVDRTAGSTDLASLREPASVMPACIDDSGARSILAPVQRFNYIRNSGFWFRSNYSSANAAGNTTGRNFPVDGWGITTSNANGVLFAPLADPTDFDLQRPVVNRAPYYAGDFTVSSAASSWRLLLSQVIEASDTNALRGQVVRLQMLAGFVRRDNAGGLSDPQFNMDSAGRQHLRVALAQLSGGTADSMPATFVSSFSAPIPVLGTGLSYIAPLAQLDGRGTIEGNTLRMNPYWDNPDPLHDGAGWSPSGSFNGLLVYGRRVGGLWQVPNTAQNLIVMVWMEQSVGSSAGVGQQGFRVSRPSLTVGQAIPEWSPLSLADELVRCQRFSCSSFPQVGVTGIVAAQNKGLAGAVKGYVNADGATAGQVLPVRFPCEMRAAPTITLFNPSAANAFVTNPVRATDASASGTANIGTTGCDVTFTGQGGSPGVRWLTGQEVAIHYTASAEI